MIKNFVTALQFLTIITVKKDHQIEESDLAKSVVYFPLVGFLLGFLLVNADKLMTFAALPQSIVTCIIITASILLTRALHIDGLADTMDGIMGGKDHASRLAIMKDSRLGTAGVLGIFFILFMKYLCLNNLFESDRVSALLLTPVLSRWTQTIMVFNADYSREEGMGKAFVGHLRSSGLAAASAIAICLSAFVVLRLDLRSVVFFCSLVAGVLLLAFLGKRYLIKKLGGMTGDSIGAMSELAEVLVMLLFVIFSSNT